MGKKDLTIEERAIRDWKSNSKIRKEFNDNLSDYVTYLKENIGKLLEERMIRDWKKDPALQKEFSSFDTYTAYIMNKGDRRADIVGLGPEGEMKDD